MRFFAAALAATLMMLQYQLWISDQGVREAARLERALAAQAAQNREHAARNRQLAAEVNDLKQGSNALEERARSELGMIGNNETFYQVVTPTTMAPAAKSTPLTARIE